MDGIHFLLKMMDFVLKMMDFVLKMTTFVLKLLNFGKGSFRSFDVVGKDGQFWPCI